jgi:acyl-CoA thioester hydrolase
MYRFDYPVRVRYAETDQMGYVYHGNYAVYYEAARTEMMRSIGLSYRAMEEQGIIMPVLSLRIDYREPALYDDLLLVRVTLTQLPAVRIEFHYEVLHEDGRLLNTAWCSWRSWINPPSSPAGTFRNGFTVDALFCGYRKNRYICNIIS